MFVLEEYEQVDPFFARSRISLLATRGTHVRNPHSMTRSVWGHGRSWHIGQQTGYQWPPRILQFCACCLLSQSTYPFGPSHDWKILATAPEGKIINLITTGWHTSWVHSLITPLFHIHHPSAHYSNRRILLSSLGQQANRESSIIKLECKTAIKAK